VNLFRGTSIFLFAILAITAAAVCARTGWAQQLIGGEFQFSQEVRWENSVLPKGDYVYIVDSSQSPAVVHVEQKGGGFSGAFVGQSSLQRDGQAPSGIVLANTGNGPYVTSFHVQALGEEFVFSEPGAETKSQPAVADRMQETMAPPAQPQEFLTILNPNREKISTEQVKKVYLRACEAVEKEFNRTIPIRPRLTLRLGASRNILHYPTREVQLRKWDQYRFADAVVELALHDMVTPEERIRLSNAAVDQAGATVDVCELKACAN
jgi:hypothetical protein